MTGKLFDEFTIDEIETQLEWLPYRKSKNPAATLVSAVRNRWAMPAAYERSRERAARTEQARRRAELTPAPK